MIRNLPEVMEIVCTKAAENRHLICHCTLVYFYIMRNAAEIHVLAFIMEVIGGDPDSLKFRSREEVSDKTSEKEL